MLNYQIATADAVFGGYLTGARDEPLPGIVLLQEIFGVNDAMRLAADQFAADGFVVLVPDLFHQIEPGIELGYSDEERDIAIGYWQKLDEATVRADVAASVVALRTHPACDGRVATVGFCLGGKQALVAAHAGLVDAAVSYYPVQAREYQELLADLKCPVQVQLGDQDAHIPEDIQHILEKATAASSKHQYHLHPGAGHGFYNSVRSFGFHPEAAALSHRQAVEFIKAALQVS
ncbi:MAG TPA: dienelactone hydrolase family protein [Pseudorhizobium sp.]|jgi:carboxymethylenebutenolidase|nr:dienelactone hydrolase family protein [Pseudorhizobium sp.]